MKKTAKYTGMAILLILMVAAVLTYLAPHFDWRVDSLCSGSMEPQLKEGSLVITRPVEPDTIAVGDIITFLPTTSDDDPITHRVIHIETNSLLHFTTRGYANNGKDSSIVSPRDLLGKVCLHIPYLGYITEFLKTPWGFMVALVIPSLAIITIYLRSIWRLVSSERKKEIPDSVAQ